MMFFFQLSEGGKSSQIKHFQDKTNKTALPIIDLIDAMKTGVIDYSVVKTGSKLTGEVQTASIALQMSQKCISPPSGLSFQRKVRRQHGSKDWSSSVCPT